MEQVKSAPQVFISHAWADKERFVTEFATRLRSNGVEAWVDSWEMNVGDSLVSKVFDEGIQGDAMIVILSNNSLNSKWVREEFDAGLVRKINERMRLIPIRLDNCEVPPCVKHLIWQEIDDLVNYDGEFKRILNSIFGQYDRPPLGDPPPHLRSELPRMPGLRPIYAKVLEAVCRVAIEAETTIADADVLSERLSRVGVTEAEIIEAQEVLDNKGLLKVLFTVGPPHVCSTQVTMEGFELFARSCLPDYGKLLADVARLLVQNMESNNRSIANELGAPLLVVEHILEALGSNGWIKYSDASGGGLHRHVYWVSPELKHELEDIQN
jgi:hypothetical protein